MELDKKISEEIIEEEEGSLENSEKGRKNTNQKSSKISSGTKDDENIDNNTNKEMKRTDTFNSFGIKGESSKYINLETNKSESENKNKEYVNNNFSERKQKKKKTLKTKDNIQIILAGYLLEIILRSKEDINVIFKRKKYKNILDEIKKTNNYFEIYRPLQEKESKNLNEILFENKRFINKPILMLNISSKEEIELEFYKYGKTFKNPIRQRFGIITNGNFYSSTEPIAKFNENKAKKKTKYILNAREIIKEDYEKMLSEKEKWHNEDKKFRIRLVYYDEKNKINNFFIYFFEEKERDDIIELIKLIQLNMTIKEPANNFLTSMEKIFNQKNKFYMILKILAIKNKLKNKIKIQDYLNNDLKNDKNEFDNFMRSIKTKIKNKYIEQKKFLYNKGIQRINKCLFLKKEIIGEENDNDEIKNYNLNDLKKACNTIYRAFSRPYYINNKIKKKNNYVSFKVKLIENNQNYFSNNEHNLYFDYKNISINYSDISFNDYNNIFLGKNEMFDISNVIYNFDIDNSKRKKEYNIAILGPYNTNYINDKSNSYRNNFSFDIQISNKKNLKNIYNKYIFNEDDKYKKFEVLICQIFNIEINKIEIKNFNFVSTIKENDFFYLKIIGGFDNNLSIKTKLFHPKIIKDKIIIEFNLELFISYEFFENEDKSIKVILYYMNNNEINGIDNDTLLVDYMNKIEIKKLVLNIDIIMNIPSYEIPFDESVKSKIFWNLIVISHDANLKENYYDYSKNKFLEKNFKIGNKFFYLEENINEKDNINSSIAYFKYEKIERYLKGIKNKENNSKIFCLCEYMGMNAKGEILFYNISNNEFKFAKYDKNKFILFSNNNFNIINNEIICNFNKISNEQFVKLFQWHKIISFQNEIQMLSFLEILKKLRRLNIYEYFYINKYVSKEQIKSPYGHEINVNKLCDKLKGDGKSKNNFNFILELNKLEFKEKYDINFNYDLDIEILSKSSSKKNANNTDIDTNKLNLFNKFIENAHIYENKFLLNNEAIESLKDDKINNNDDVFIICNNIRIKLKQNCFIKNGKIINFEKLRKDEKEINFNFDLFNFDLIIIKLDWYKTKEQKDEKHMYVLIDINKDIFNSIIIKNLIKNNSSQNDTFNFSDIYVDYFILPVFLFSDTRYKNIFEEQKNNKNGNIISGILTFKIICYKPIPKYENKIGMNLYEEIRDKNIKEYIKYYSNKTENVNKTIAIYEPNIYKNYILSKIIKFYEKKKKIDTNEYLNNKGILNEILIPDLKINDEKNSKYFFNKFKKYISKYKSNIIYNRYIENLWERILMNENNINNIYFNFFSKEELLDLSKKENDLFYRIKDLIHMGLPNLQSRSAIWDKLLNINDLVNKTANKLSDYHLYNYSSININGEGFKKIKGEIYIILNEVLKTQESEEYLLLIDNIIDLNIFSLKSITNNLDLIKKITTIFYQWTLLNIGETSNANVLRSVSKIKNINEIFDMKSFSKNKYSYYCGVLYLCEKLFQYFKSPSETFWYLVGLSQVIPFFNINYNLYELTIYNLVIKLILEQHHPNLYKKIVSINFPFEYIFSKHITYFYSSFFEDIELFMKIMDIFIFESVFSKNNYDDPINHIRFLCTIIITIIVENEDKILAAENIFQLENLFEIIKHKNYNLNNFFKKINLNINKYFDIKEKDKLSLMNNNWDNNRITIEKIMDRYYYSYIKNIYSYMEKNFKEMNLVIQNNKEEDSETLNDKTNRINVFLWKEKIRKYLYKYSYNEKNNIRTSNNKNPNKGILMIFRGIKILNFNNKDYALIGESEINIFSEKNQNSNSNKLVKKIIINEKGNITNKEENDLYCLIDYKYHFKDEAFIIITFCNNGIELFRFKLNIDSITLLNPIKLEIHSIKSKFESTVAIFELSIMKYYNYLLQDEYCKLFLSFFSPNEFKIDNIINSKYLEFKNIPNFTELICEEKSNLKFEDNLHKNIDNIYHQKIPLIYQYYLDRNFLGSNKKFKTNNNKQHLEEIKKIINELFLIDGDDKNNYTEKIINLIDKENKFNNITIMEILICLYLDNDLMNLNMNDILFNLYNFAMISNKKNICNISNIIELIYILYKKYSMFYKYDQVKSMVNYYFKKEKYSMIKNVLIYNKTNRIENILANKDTNEIKNEFKRIKKLFNYKDITSDFLFIYDNFSEICQMFDFYNKTDLNPKSKNNVVLILKIILYDILLKNNTNSENKDFDYNSFDFIVIEYYKEYSCEYLFFSINYNEKANNFDVNFLDINNRYGNLNTYYEEKRFENKNIYELILLYANSNFLFNNINNDYLEYNISFDNFKNIFTHLPYLNDILYKNIYKRFSWKNCKLLSNKNTKYDKVSVSIMNNSKKIFEFIFVSNAKNKNYLYNSNFTRIYNSIIINYNIFSNFSIKKIFDIIVNKIEYQDLKQFVTLQNTELNYNKIKDSISDFKNISFYAIDENNKYIILEPLLPLYINFSNYYKNTLTFYLDITYSYFLKNNNIIKYKGYCKFPLNKEYEIYQWRKCSLLKIETKNLFKVKLKCFRIINKAESKLINLNKNNIRKDYDINNDKTKELNSFENIINVEKEFIDDNLIISSS